MAASLDPIALGLPHREPFVFIDHVTELVPGERAVATKRFASEDSMFRGHFPGEPIVPGVILTEALAQLSGIVAGHAGRALRLAAIKSMKFPAAARPDETIVLQAKLSGAVGGLIQCAVEARIEDRPVADGVIVLAEPPAV
jgi:3-hydroxyacyl-[acyl-carrier-protein] dehydratase